MHRCYLEPDAWHDSDVRLSEPEAHHLLHVLRAGPGDAVSIFDGAGRSAIAHVAGQGPGLEIDASSIRQQKRHYHCTLFMAVIKSARMDWAVEKATELGASEICPLICDRGVVRVKKSEAEKKRERWQRIALSAAKQCGTPWLPAVLLPEGISGAVHRAASLTGQFIADLEEAEQALSSAVGQLPGAAGPPHVGLWVGPEGDFTENEKRVITAGGARPVTLGPFVLRAETAALFGLSVVAASLADG